MILKTDILAVHSIQKNMLGISLFNDVLLVLLINGNVLRIETSNNIDALNIFNKLHFYPSEGKENNSVSVPEYHMSVIQA